MTETYGYRLTIYCNSQEQKNKIQNEIRNTKIKNKFKKTGDALEKIIEDNHASDKLSKTICG